MQSEDGLTQNQKRASHLIALGCNTLGIHRATSNLLTTRILQEENIPVAMQLQQVKCSISSFILIDAIKVENVLLHDNVAYSDMSELVEFYRTQLPEGNSILSEGDPFDLDLMNKKIMAGFFKSDEETIDTLVNSLKAADCAFHMEKGTTPGNAPIKATRL